MQIPPTAIEGLKAYSAALRQSDQYKDIVEPKENVLRRFQALFSPANIASLTKEDFCAFLDKENNHHWSGLNRHPKIYQDMNRLKTALTYLVDDSKSIERRLDQAISTVPGMGKAIATAILFVCFPEKYGVWNQTSESAMRRLNIFPEKDWGESKGQQYTKINELLVSIATQLQTDLWTLDALWWFIETSSKQQGILANQPPQIVSEPELTSNGQRFRLEQHLHDFIFDNWDNIDLGKDWEIYGEDGDPDIGYKYRTRDAGEIDILAKHRTEPRWLVVELKRDQSSD
ncbi:MAG: hypothetical protein K2X29_00875, partial [Candidatus Obscuribacterales bacterium]|nr:hypothetical protein [Candidatus Obscuribacterales bacterium]